MDPFRRHVAAAIAATPVRELVAAREAVVLERIARGAGATNWYYCRSAEQLDVVIERLRPGSVVSFYFDGRVGKISDIASLARRVEDVVASSRECVVAALAVGESRLSVDFVNGLQDLSEFLEDHSSSSVFFAGEFPGRDNDGYNAVTFTVPDEDGVVRGHPH